MAASASRPKACSSEAMRDSKGVAAAGAVAEKSGSAAAKKLVVDGARAEAEDLRRRATITDFFTDWVERLSGRVAGAWLKTVGRGAGLCDRLAEQGW